MAMTGAMLAFGGLWGVPYLERAHDLPKAEAAGLVSVLFVGWGIGAPVWGIVSDRLSRRRPFIAVGGVLATAGMAAAIRSEEHTSELQSLMRISYAVFCLKKKNTQRATRAYKTLLDKHKDSTKTH